MIRRLTIIVILAILAIPVTAAAQCVAAHCVYVPIGVQGTWPTPSSDPSPTALPSASPSAAPTPSASPSPSASASPSPAPSTPPPSNTITWTSAASYPTETSEAQGVVVNGKLYVFGGFKVNGNYTPFDTAYVFDPSVGSQGQWTPRKSMPPQNDSNPGGVTHAPMTTDGQDIFWAGGYISNATGTGQIFGTRDVWRYNVASDAYTKLASLPISIAAGQLIYLNNELHYIGGTIQNKSQDVGTHYVLQKDSTTGAWKDQWITKAPLPNPRQHAAAVALNGKIYYIGGQKGHDSQLIPQDDVHVYDPATDTWEQLANMPRPINHASSSTFVMNGRIIVVGGQMRVINGISEKVNNVTAYDPATNTWSEMTPLPVAKHSGVAGVIGNTIYFTTGEGSDRRKTHKGVVSAAPTVAQPDDWTISGLFRSLFGNGSDQR